MGQREWWLVHSPWQHDVVSGYCRLEETLLYVISFSLDNGLMQFTDKPTGCCSCCWYVSIAMVLDNSN